MASTQRLLFCLPTDDFAICLCYILYNVQKQRRPLIPVENLDTLSIQPICLPAFVILWCLHQYSGGRKTWKHVMSVATPADGERKSTSMNCVFRHTVKKCIKQECTDSGRIQMDTNQLLHPGKSYALQDIAWNIRNLHKAKSSFNTEWSQTETFLWGLAGWMLPPSARCSTDIGRGNSPNKMC